MYVERYGISILECSVFFLLKMNKNVNRNKLLAVS
jgi:hypothetical protein